MKRIICIFFILLLIESGITFSYADNFDFKSQKIPQPTNYVNDFAHILSPITIQSLNQELAAYQNETTNQIVVATFSGHVPGTIEEFSVNLEEQWKIGQKGKDNGIILVIFPDDRQLRIEVGYGLEGVLPDSLTHIISSQKITPFFKQQKYDEGVTSGVHSIIHTISPNFAFRSYNPIKNNSNLNTKQNSPWWVVFVLFVGFMVGGGLGPLIALIMCISILGGVLGFFAWCAGFIIYAIIYYSLPVKYRFNRPWWLLLLGGFAGLNRNGRNGRGGNFGGGSSGSNFGGGGGGTSGGGGSSDKW